MGKQFDSCRNSRSAMTGSRASKESLGTDGTFTDFWVVFERGDIEVFFCVHAFVARLSQRSAMLLPKLKRGRNTINRGK